MSGPDDVLLFPSGTGVPPDLLAALEAILFASAGSVRLQRFADLLPDVDPRRIREALEVLERRYEDEARGLVLVEVGGGWHLRTDARFAELVRQVVTDKPVRLSRAALEALAVVAWEQPATKADIDAVRGVDSGGTLRKLLELGLVRVAGRRDIPGRPLEYRTTRAFLELFGLPDLGALPHPDEAGELDGER